MVNGAMWISRGKGEKVTAADTLEYEFMFCLTTDSNVFSFYIFSSKLNELKVPYGPCLTNL